MNIYLKYIGEELNLITDAPILSGIIFFTGYLIAKWYYKKVINDLKSQVNTIEQKKDNFNCKKSNFNKPQKDSIEKSKKESSSKESIEYGISKPMRSFIKLFMKRSDAGRIIRRSKK